MVTNKAPRVDGCRYGRLKINVAKTGNTTYRPLGMMFKNDVKRPKKKNAW